MDSLEVCMSVYCGHIELRLKLLVEHSLIKTRILSSLKEHFKPVFQNIFDQALSKCRLQLYQYASEFVGMMDDFLLYYSCRKTLKN